MACRSAGTPCIGAYWLRPSRMYRATASTSAGSQSKSGNPCDRLIAPRSAASFDITVKIVVPTLGSFDVRTRVITATCLSQRASRLAAIRDGRFEYDHGMVDLDALDDAGLFAKSSDAGSVPPHFYHVMDVPGLGQV